MFRTCNRPQDLKSEDVTLSLTNIAPRRGSLQEEIDLPGTPPPRRCLLLVGGRVLYIYFRPQSKEISDIFEPEFFFKHQTNVEPNCAHPGVPKLRIPAGYLVDGGLGEPKVSKFSSSVDLDFNHSTTISKHGKCFPTTTMIRHDHQQRRETRLASLFTRRSTLRPVNRIYEIMCVEFPGYGKTNIVHGFLKIPPKETGILANPAKNRMVNSPTFFRAVLSASVAPTEPLGSWNPTLPDFH